MALRLKTVLVLLALAGCDASMDIRRGTDDEGEMWVDRLREEPLDQFVRDLDVQGRRADRWLRYFEKHPDAGVRVRAQQAVRRLESFRQGEVRFWSKDPAGEWIATVADPDGSHRRPLPPNETVPDVTTLAYPQGTLRLRGPAVPNADGSLVAFPAGEENIDIYLSDPEGKNVRRLTTIEGADQGPVWSPDGHDIAFVSERDRNAEVYVVNIDTRKLRRITTWPEEDGAPRWAKDGTAIFFESIRLSRWQIYRYDLSTEQLTRVSDETADDRFTRP